MNQEIPFNPEIPTLHPGGIGGCPATPFLLGFKFPDTIT